MFGMTSELLKLSELGMKLKVKILTVMKNVKIVKMVMSSSNSLRAHQWFVVCSG